MRGACASCLIPSLDTATGNRDLILAQAFWRLGLSVPAFARMRLAMGFAPTESESGAAAVAFNRGLFDAVAAFFREAALLHRSMKGRSRPLAGSGPLDDATLREASRQFMHGIFS